MTINELINHHIEQAKLLNGLYKIALEDGVYDMKTEEMIAYHMRRAVELRAKEIVEDREEPKWYYFLAGLVVGSVIGGAVVALLL
tara:strand:- start:50 stop:304 length:255 start_codon:yes stop_codon:yes gene_type:complete